MVSPVYLGDNWITNVIASCFISLTICLTHWVFYRRIESPKIRTQLPMVIIFSLLALTSCFSYRLNLKKMIHTHTPHLEQYVMTDDVWWNQQRPLLPLYTTDHIGQHTGLLNIQYAGSLQKIRETLEANGWKEKSNSIFYSLLMRAGSQNPADKLPLMSQLYLNKAPVLVLTYNSQDESKLIILSLWRSNYHLRHYLQPLWLGSLRAMNIIKKPTHSSSSIETLDNIILKALPGFKTNHIPLPKRCLQPLPYHVDPTLLIIKEPDMF